MTHSSGASYLQPRGLVQVSTGWQLTTASPVPSTAGTNSNLPGAMLAVEDGRLRSRIGHYSPSGEAASGQAVLLRPWAHPERTKQLIRPA